MLAVLVALSTVTLQPLLMPLLAEKSMSMSWALVLLCVILGLAVSLLPSKRTSEVKRPKDD
jgi:hypothetical protein